MNAFLVLALIIILSSLANGIPADPPGPESSAPAEPPTPPVEPPSPPVEPPSPPVEPPSPPSSPQDPPNTPVAPSSPPAGPPSVPAPSPNAPSPPSQPSAPPGSPPAVAPQNPQIFAGPSHDVPNPGTILTANATGEVLKLLLRDPQLRARLEQLQGPINEDIGGEVSSGCLVSGSRYPTVNLRVDHEQPDEGEGSIQWRQLNVNRLYGVLRDRFFAQNLEGGMMTIQFRRGEATTAAVLFGLEDDWAFQYVLAKADLFWSMDNNFGAQHSISLQTYPFEVQLVHYKKDLKSLTEAAGQKHGILILSILFEAAGKPNPSLDPLAAAAVMSIFPSDKLQVVHGPIDIKALFPFDLSNLQYTGAYLSHPCSREAKWVVFRHPRTIAYKQLKKFREIRESAGRKNPGVFLPLAHGKVEDQEVFASKHVQLKVSLEEDISNEGNRQRTSSSWIICLLLIIISSILRKLG